MVNGLLPFNSVENGLFRKHVKHDPISSDTFMKYLNTLTEHVENKISQILPSQIALVFDGWTSGSTHYLAVFSSFPAQNDNGFVQDC